MPVASGAFVTECFAAARDEFCCALSQPVMAPLASHAVVRVHGPDAASFLHAQFTADVGALAPGDACLAAWCTPKGRVIALLHVLRRPEDFLLVTAADLVEPLLRRLRMYVLRAKVTLDDWRGVFGVLGVAGHDASGRLTASRTRGVDDASLSPGCALSPVPGSARRLLLAAPEALACIWDGLAADGVAAVGETAWRALLVRDAEPWVTGDSSEAHLPQMLNLDRLGGVSFTKGCYPGQEIVARTRYLGQLKRRLYIGSCASAEPPRTGASLLAVESGQSVGHVLLAAPAVDPERSAFSAVVRIEAASQPLHVDSEGGADAQLREPPYPLSEG